MAEHVHEYQWKSIHRKYLCIHCPKALNVYEAMPLLNATERLSAEDADEIAEYLSVMLIMGHINDASGVKVQRLGRIARAYAEILEEK